MQNTQSFLGYMPKSDVGKMQWMQAFVTTATEMAETLCIAPRDLEYLQNTVQRFMDALGRIDDRGQRTPSAIGHKNAVRADAVALCRSMAMQIKANPSIPRSLLIVMGIHVNQSKPRRTPRPDVAPQIAVAFNKAGGHIICFRADELPKSENTVNIDGRETENSACKAKPVWASHLLLFACIGDKADASIREARLLGAYTKQPIEVAYPPNAGVAGRCATYYARWLTSTGQMGPWSNGVSMIIAAESGSNSTAFSHLFPLNQPAPAPGPGPETVPAKGKTSGEPRLAAA